MIDTSAPRKQTPAKRRWLFPVLAVLAAAALLFVIGRQNEASIDVQSPADREAGLFADMSLLERLSATVNPESVDPVADVEALLDSMSGQPVPGSYISLLAGPRQGSKLGVAVYFFWSNTSFSGAFDGSPSFGRACRIYSVSNHTVGVEPVDCPESVPEEPAGPTLSDTGWFAGSPAAQREGVRATTP